MHQEICWYESDYADLCISIQVGIYILHTCLQTNCLFVLFTFIVTVFLRYLKVKIEFKNLR